jgi:uncharacterized membrane protein
MFSMQSPFGYYELLLVIHLLTVVIGIGSVMLNGVYGAQAKKAGPNGGNAVVRANFEVTKLAELFIYAIPVTGILMVLASDDQWKFSQLWVSASIVLYLVAIANAHINLRPGAKKMIELTQGPPTPEMETWGKRLAIAGTTNDLIAVALITLMVWKPGA